ncbi:MAG: hypothetical protein COT73_05170 [Bdellovibrio sp. CG10_big_fil_rev_8_21_14_0_10_47_8]|nr:MAG: hypothetical protein COT73_05170 [Bdellovibrio sp. CG10_big_fil_rev_8_21_14_0_10_47_8]
MLSALALVFIAGCGNLDNVVQLDFKSPDSQGATVTSNPGVGLLSASGTKTSGQFKFEGSIGNQVPTVVQTSGAFKFYGGISGEVLSR